MKNNRAEVRVKTKVKSEVHSDEAMTFSTTSDLSNGGVFIHTLEPLKEGSDVELSIKIPGKVSLDVKGVVRWIKEESDSQSGMGIEFVDLNDEKKEIIENGLSS